MKKKLLLLVPLAVLVLGIIAVLVLRRTLPPERILALVEPRLESALGRDVEIGKASLRFWPLAVRLESVRVQANPGFSSPWLLDLQALSLELRLLPLLRRAVDARSLILEQPRLFVEQDAQGRWNFAASKAAGNETSTAPAATGSPMALRIRNLNLREGALQLRMAERDLELQLPLDADLSLDLDRSLQNAQVRGWIECRGVTAGGSLQKLPPLDLRLEPELRANLVERSAHIDLLRLQLQEFAVELEGQAALQDGKPVVQLRTRSNAFELGQLLKLMPQRTESVEATGTVQLDVSIDVPATGASRFDGTLRLDGGRLRAPQWPAALENVQVRALFAGDSLRVHTLDAEFAGSALHVQGTLHPLLDPSRSAYDVNLRTQLDLAKVSPLLHQAAPASQDLDLRGHLEADVRARGAVAAKSLPALQGPIRLEDVEVRAPQLARPLTLQAALRAEGTHLEIESARLDTGDSRVQASGTLALALPPEKPSLTLRGQTQSLDLDALLAKPHDGAGKAAAPGGAPSTQPVLPPLPPMHLDVELEAAQAQVQRARLRQTVLAWRSDPARFRLQLQAESMQQENVVLQGCRGELEGTPAAASGKLTARSGTLGKIQASDLQGDLTVEGSQIELTNLRARTYDGNLQGRIGLDLADPAQPRQELELNMDAVQLSGLLNDLFRAGGLVVGTLSGRSSWNASGSGAESIRKQLSGSGEGIAVNGRLRELPLLTQVSSLLGVPSLAQLQYKEVGFQFTVQEGQVQLPQLQMQGHDADARVDGRIGLDGGLDLALNLKLSEAATRQALQHPATRALGGLFTDPQGRLVLDFDVAGTLKAPKVQVDLQATASRSGLRSLGEQELKRLLGNVLPPADAAKEELGRSLGDAVKGIFQKKPAAKDTTAKP